MLLHASVPLHFHLFVDSDTKPTICVGKSYTTALSIAFCLLYDLESIRWKIDWG